MLVRESLIADPVKPQESEILSIEDTKQKNALPESQISTTLL
jgi:hypothetical protein